jgi:hypothetical protein
VEALARGRIGQRLDQMQELGDALAVDLGGD